MVTFIDTFCYIFIPETLYAYMYKRYIDWTEAKQRLRDKITQSINKKTKKNPIVIVTIVDINNKQ